MIQQMAVTFSFALGFTLILALCESIYARLSVQPEYTRKLAHIVATLSSLLFLHHIHSHWYILFLGLVFFLLLYLTKRHKKTQSIHAVSRPTMGSYLLPIAIYLVFFLHEQLQQDIYYVLPLLILAISDPLAGIFGTFYKNKTREIRLFGESLHKTYLGSTVFFTSSLLISYFMLHFYAYPFGKSLYLAISIALGTTFTEMLSTRGLDNLTIPLMTILLLEWL